jgi:hypothetical protein
MTLKVDIWGAGKVDGRASFPFTSSPPNVCPVWGSPFTHPTRTVSPKF